MAATQTGYMINTVNVNSEVFLLERLALIAVV